MVRLLGLVSLVCLGNTVVYALPSSYADTLSRPDSSLFFQSSDEGSQGGLMQALANKDHDMRAMDAALVEDCGTDEDILHLQGLLINPLPPKRGQNLTIEATGTLSESIEEGAYITLAVRYGVVRLINKRLDLCEQSEAQVNVSCPIEAGKHTVERTVALPSQIPKGKYTVDGRAYTADGRSIACLHGVVTFS